MNENKKITISLRLIRSIFLVSIVGIVIFAAGYFAGREGWALTINRNNIPGGETQVSLLPGRMDFDVDISRETPEGKPASFEQFWTVWDKVQAQYIDGEEIDEQKMVYGAIEGMVEAVGDPYTLFLPPKDNSRSQEDLKGSFSGVGIQLGYKDDPDTENVERLLAVIAPLEGMPAQEVGVKAGDLILEIDGEDATDMALPDAVEKIRGPEGTSVRLMIYTEGDPDTREVDITRGEILVPSVKYQIVQDNDSDTKVGHLRVSRFGERTLEEIEEYQKQILSEWQSGQIEGLILDLRSNPGGYFQGAINIASLFVESGVVVQQEDAAGNREPYRARGNAPLKGIPLVILINEGSASSSEITAGAIRELTGATLVGKKTFGKGTVQQAEDFENGSGIHITTHRWLLPSGASIDKTGISPDIEVEYEVSEEDLGDEVVYDSQLREGINVLGE